MAGSGDEDEEDEVAETTNQGGSFFDGVHAYSTELVCHCGSLPSALPVPPVHMMHMSQFRTMCLDASAHDDTARLPLTLTRARLASRADRRHSPMTCTKSRFQANQMMTMTTVVRSSARGGGGDVARRTTGAS